MKKLVEQFIKQYDKAITQVELIQKDIDKKRELIESDKREANKKINWNLEFNDPKGYLKGLLSKAGKF